MAKLESTFKNMVLSLVIISVVAAGALAGVYILTLETINAQKAAKQQEAILAVLPTGAQISETEEVNGLTIYHATINGIPCGAAVKTEADGFGGPQKIMVGLNPEGLIYGYEVLEHQETPGLGDKISTWFKNPDKPAQSIITREAGKLVVSKDGGEVDAITAATISSRAFLSAINKAHAAYMNGHVDAHTGASQQVQSDEVQSDKGQGDEVQSDNVQSDNVQSDENQEKEDIL